MRQKNVGLNVGLNKTEKAVLRLLIDNADRNADMIAAEIGVTKRTIERAFASLQQKGKSSVSDLSAMGNGWLFNEA